MTTLSADTLDPAPSRRSFWPRAFSPLIGGIFLALISHIFAQRFVGGYGVNLLLLCGIYVILAVSLTIVNGFTGQFSIGHAGFMAVGGYTAAAIVYYGSLKLFGDAQFHGGALSWGGRAGGFTGSLLASGDLLFVAACIAGGIVAAAAGWIVGLPSLRLRGDYLAIVTLGFGEIVRVVLQATAPQLMSLDEMHELGQRTLEHPGGLLGHLTIVNHLGGALGFILLPTYSTVFWVYLWTAIMLIVAVRLKYSSYGRALLSIREDEIAAQAVGINITKYKVRAFVLSSFFAGVAGALYAMQQGSINAGELGFQQSFVILIMVVLGGLGSISGAALAAILLIALPEALRSFEQYRMIVYALVLIIVMIVRPEGLFGVREVWDLVRRRRRA